jgi:conjugal transfer pilus assembly protein TraI
LYPEHNILDDLVRRSVALVVDRYLQASADRYGTPQLGSHLERYLVDAIRRLVSSNSAWIPNAEKSRVWFGSDGLFIVWPNAAAEIRILLESDQLPGIPKAPETILEILVAAGVFEPKSPTQLTWQIVPPDNKTAIEAVKLSSPTILFADIGSAPKPLSIGLVRAVPSATDNASTPPSAKATEATKVDQRRQPVQQLPLPIEAESIETQQGTAAPTAIVGEIDVPPLAAAASISPTTVNSALVVPKFKLDAPMRLNSAVRDALEQIVDTLNQDSNVAACTVSLGLFVPLVELGRRKIQPPQMLRALAEARMLVLHNGAQTHMRDFGGEQKMGLLLHPRFITGLDPSNFDVPPICD